MWEQDEGSTQQGGCAGQVSVGTGAFAAMERNHTLARSLRRFPGLRVGPSGCHYVANGVGGMGGVLPPVKRDGPRATRASPKGGGSWVGLKTFHNEELVIIDTMLRCKLIEDAANGKSNTPCR